MNCITNLPPYILKFKLDQFPLLGLHERNFGTKVDF